MYQTLLRKTCLSDRFIKDACVSNEKYQTRTKSCKMVPKSTSQLMVGKNFNRTPDLSIKYIKLLQIPTFPPKSKSSCTFICTISI